MSRKEINNPSQRMGRVLDDFDSLDNAYDALVGSLAEPFSVVDPTGYPNGERAAIEAFMLKLFTSMASKPLAEAVINEKARRQYTMGKVDQARTRMRTMRSRGPGSQLADRHVRGMKVTNLTDEQVAGIMKEVSTEKPEG